MIENIEFLSPYLVVAIGVVVGMLVVSYRRSKQSSAAVCMLTSIVSIMSAIYLLPFVGSGVYVTTMVFINAFSLQLFILMMAALLLICYQSLFTLRHTIEFHDEYYLLLLLASLGAAFLSISSHFGSLFIAFELLSISLVGLVGYMRRCSHGIEASFKYLILSASASSFMLLGMAFIYSQTGQLSLIQDYSINIAELSVFQAGLFLLASGLLFKLSLVPFHVWAPDVYQGASAPITFFLSTISKVAMLAIVIRIFDSLAKGAALEYAIYTPLLVIAILSMVVGNLLAIKQVHLKRLLAYSSIAHMGYLLTVIFVLGEQSVLLSERVSITYLASYVLASAGLFTLISWHEKEGQSIELTIFDGLFWTSRLKAVFVLLCVLSLAGIPLTFGFIGKFYLMSFVTENHQWWLLSGIIIGSGISLVYYLPIVFRLFSREKPSNSFSSTEVFMFKPFCLACSLIIVFLGIWPQSFFNIIS